MSFVDYTCADGVARVTLVEGDRGNPVHLDSITSLFRAVRRARVDGARVILLSATGRFFCVGGDLVDFAGRDDVEAYVDDVADVLHRVVSELVRADAVVVCAVQGAAAGAGFPLAAAADVVLAAESARFTLGYTRVGLAVDGGTTQLVHTLGLHRTLRLALLNDTLTAAEARDAGLVARVVPDDELGAAAEELAGRLASGPAGAQAAVKRLVRDAADADPEGGLRREALAIRSAAGSADGREGVRAFVEKRSPAFG